ncbi:MAG: hypothetical protein PHS93_10295 [Candidatus Omnitrophica bacterium]|nr:hypothetical protein [Candidatus Omnitrophota bacterium]
MEEKQTKNFTRSNWFAVVITWTGLITWAILTFYFNTNTSVSAHETKLNNHEIKIEQIDNTVQTKASKEDLEKLKQEKDQQIKVLTETKVDKDYLMQVDKKMDLIISLVRDANTKIDNHINRDK